MYFKDKSTVFTMTDGLLPNDMLLIKLFNFFPPQIYDKTTLERIKTKTAVYENKKYIIIVDS